LLSSERILLIHGSLTECVLHHTAAAVLNLSRRHACLAEHFLPETENIAYRVEYQLATEDEGSLMRILRKTNAEMMRPLCLNIEVNTEWDTVPEAVRQAVVHRLIGKPTAMTSTLASWMTSVSRDLNVEDFHVSMSLWIFQITQNRLAHMHTHAELPRTPCEPAKAPAQLQIRELPPAQPRSLLAVRFLFSLFHRVVIMAKWIAILSGAASEVERELWYSLHGNKVTEILLTVILLVWRACWSVKNVWVSIFLIYRRPALSKIIRLALRGTSRELVGDLVLVELPEITVTGFARASENATLDIFEGSLEQPPIDKHPLATAYYSNVQLQSRQDFRGDVIIESTYHYSNKSNRYPTHKDVIEPSRSIRYRYDQYGRVVSGTLVTASFAEIGFSYHYRKYPKGNSDLLRAHYRNAESSQTILSVYWGVSTNSDAEEDDMATPSDRITRIIRYMGRGRYVTTYSYQHKHDPRISTEVEEAERRTLVAHAPKTFEIEDELLKKPKNLTFDSDDLLVHHRRGLVRKMFSGSSGPQGVFSKIWNKAKAILPFGSSFWIRKVVYHRIPTWRLRAELWKIWLDTTSLDAVTACYIDELILREEPLLKTYWWMRTTGRLGKAKEALDKDIDKIVSAIEMPTEVSETCTLPIKPADLYTMGLGKDAQQITTRPQDCFQDSKDRISVIFNDVGCWPDAPGGVSNCRRDLINGHKTIRNHVLAESPHDYGISRFQLEKSVQSLKTLPLWGLDFKTAQHGLIDNLLQSEVDMKIEETDVRDIVEVFIPALRKFVKGSRTKRASRAELLSCSDALLTMSTFFEQKDYNKTWTSKEVEAAWIKAWLEPHNNPNILDPNELFELERPSMADFKEGLALYTSYFLIYSVQIPDACPRVFQSTHHGISSLFGMILKYRKGTTFALWDHAILWRECCLNISPAQCLLPISVQAMLLGGIGLAAKLAYLHADVLLPCTSVFNP
jgi:hypothetical protein